MGLFSAPHHGRDISQLKHPFDWRSHGCNDDNTFTQTSSNSQLKIHTVSPQHAKKFET
jgi:hypothetical protein